MPSLQVHCKSVAIRNPCDAISKPMRNPSDAISKIDKVERHKQLTIGIPTFDIGAPLYSIWEMAAIAYCTSRAVGLFSSSVKCFCNSSSCWDAYIWSCGKPAAIRKASTSFSIGHVSRRRSPNRAHRSSRIFVSLVFLFVFVAIYWKTTSESSSQAFLQQSGMWYFLTRKQIQWQLPIQQTNMF